MSEWTRSLSHAAPPPPEVAIRSGRVASAPSAGFAPYRAPAAWSDRLVRLARFVWIHEALADG